MPRRKPNQPARLDNEQRRRQQWNMGEAGNDELIQGELTTYLTFKFSTGGLTWILGHQ